jgi:hypothetical protein
LELRVVTYATNRHLPQRYRNSLPSRAERCGDRAGTTYPQAVNPLLAVETRAAAELYTTVETDTCQSGVRRPMGGGEIQTSGAGGLRGTQQYFAREAMIL